jgi:hypothetical protein
MEPPALGQPPGFEDHRLDADALLPFLMKRDLQLKPLT